MTPTQLCDENHNRELSLDGESRWIRSNIESTRLAELIKIDHPTKIRLMREPDLMLEDRCAPGPALSLAIRIRKLHFYNARQGNQNTQCLRGFEDRQLEHVF